MSSALTIGIWSTPVQKKFISYLASVIQSFAPCYGVETSRKLWPLLQRCFHLVLGTQTKKINKTYFSKQTDSKLVWKKWPTRSSRVCYWCSDSFQFDVSSDLLPNIAPWNFFLEYKGKYCDDGDVICASVLQ